MRDRFFDLNIKTWGTDSGCLYRVDVDMDVFECLKYKHSIYSPSTLRLSLPKYSYCDLTLCVGLEQYCVSNRFRKIVEGFIGKNNNYLTFVPAFTESKEHGTRLSYAMLYNRELEGIIDYTNSKYAGNSITVHKYIYDQIKDLDIFIHNTLYICISKQLMNAFQLAGLKTDLAFNQRCYTRNGQSYLEDPELTPKRVQLKPGSVFRVPGEGGSHIYAQLVADDPLQLNSQIVRVVVSDTELTAKKVAKTETAFFAHLYLKAAVEAWDWEKIGSANMREDALDGITFYEGEDVMMVDNDHIELVDPLDNVDTWKHGDTDRLHLGILPAGEGLRLEDATIVPPPYIAYRALHDKYPHSIHDCHPSDRT